MAVKKNTSDENDSPTKSDVTYLNLGVLLYSIIFHFVDVGYDIYTAHKYFKTGKYSYFTWTIAFILIPSVIMALISIKMYIEDSKHNGNCRNAYFRIALCIVGLVVQSAPLIRYCDAFWYACKSLKAKWCSDKIEQERYYSKMADEDSDVSLLRVFECYLESAPQQVLQVTLLLLDFIRGSDDYTTNQFIILILSFVFMGVCMANYHRLIRNDQADKNKISTLGLLVQFLWHLNFTVSRILAIAALATLNPFWTCVAVLFHWFIMSIWVAGFVKTQFCGENKIEEFFFSAAMGLIYIFNFISLKDGPTRKFYLVFYTLSFVESVSAAVIWGIFSTSFMYNWIYYAFAVLPVVTFILGITFFAIYYQFLHPNLQKFHDKSNKEVFYDYNKQSEELEVSLTQNYTNNSKESSLEIKTNAE